MKDSTKNNKPLAPASTGPVASSSANIKVKAPERGTLVRKTGNAKGATDPYVQQKPSRSNVMSAQAQGRNGAAYGIRVGVGAAQVAPEAGMTQSNGRLVRPAMNRQRPSFQEGMQG
jgi:hypothetical protein